MFQDRTGSVYPAQWQHLTKPVAFLNEKDWDKLGEDGWELVTVDRGIAHFKRPKRATHLLVELDASEDMP